MSSADDGSPLERKIRDEIAARGGILPFTRFMELALYAPGLGYYERSAHVVGRHGDFYTSVSVGQVFGELLAFQFARWLEELAPGQPLFLIEAGAHDGRLAADILTWLVRYRPHLGERIQLCLVEPSPVRREWQAETLAAFRGRIRWTPDLNTAATEIGDREGILYANELLDAFPVHRVTWHSSQGRWRELGVGWDGGRFCWVPLETPSDGARAGLEALQGLPAELLAVLPDGFSTELASAAAEWWAQASRLLRRGRILTLDYGLDAEEFLLPQRSAGTLRSYAGHRPGADPLEQPGEQDLTAHVNFTEIEAAGLGAGLVTEFRGSQRQWLTSVFSETLKHPGEFPEWNSQRVRQFQTLTHPQHLGRSFRVLVQRRWPS